MAVTGAREVKAAFDAFEAGVAADCRQIVAATVARVHAAARARVAVGRAPGIFSGHLRDQIRRQMAQDAPQGAVWVEKVAPTDNRGLWMEYGTVAHAMPRRGGWQPAILAEGPHRPFMRPAVDAERGSFEGNLRAALESRASQF